MKNLLIATALMAGVLTTQAEEKKVFRISTDKTDLVLQVGDNGRLYQTYFGEKLLNEADYQNLSWDVHAGSDGSISQRGWEVYSGSGNEDYFEPAIAITHNDGKNSTYLYYVSSTTQPVEGGTQTTINLRDDKYPVDVTLHYVAYPKENVIKTWSEIKHQEKKPIILSTYASTMLYFCNSSYYLTEFSSDWACEARMSNQQLQFGKKVIDTKLGSRAAMHTHPFFEVGLDQPVSEQKGQVLMGTLGWTGNFRFTFEVDNAGNLRVIPGINPYASNYELKKDEVFTTPEFIFTLSYNGTSEGSRNLHEWARNYSLKDGKGSRLTLLNNWENTGFDFNQEILANLMKEAKHLGVDMFLLDDGWFANKYPRKDDKAGLGDWEVTHDKLPGGVPALVKAAKEAGVKFGIWIEPEMVNPKSELFEKHPDWAIHDENRKIYYYRNQLVLDLSNPEVQDYVYGVVEKLMKEKAIFYEPCKNIGTVVYVAREGKFLGSIVIADTVKDGAKEAIASMKKVGVKKCVMLTGDRKEAAEGIAAELGIDEVHAELLPQDKVSQVERLLKEENEKEKLAFVGDGINDAPVLTRADIGIAMGSMGSDAAIEAADVVLMDDDIRKIASIVRISRKTLGIVKQNIVFALAVKAIVLVLGAFGVANMWEAVFADVGVSVIAILNSMRALKTE